MARASGLSRQTLHSGLKELEAPARADGRIRDRGAGRKPMLAYDPGLKMALDELIDPDLRSDPESPLRWTCKSTRQLAKTLTETGHPVSPTTVGMLLKSCGYSLQANVKTKEGSQRPDRDAQFRYLNERAREFRDAGLPLISVDCKKKELVGKLKNRGRERTAKGRPIELNVHDFITEQTKAIAYGVYDIERDAGWINVSQDHETAAFAVESLRRWWSGEGSIAYPDADKLLICADGAGVQGSWTLLWKTELWRFATEAALAVTVCHLPPGTSKWKEIEHRLFSHISKNWRGRPLTAHEVVIELIAAAANNSGLRLRAQRDLRTCRTKIEVTDAELTAVNVRPHDFQGACNYTLDART